MWMSCWWKKEEGRGSGLLEFEQRPSAVVADRGGRFVLREVARRGYGSEARLVVRSNGLGEGYL